jgi:hypothetical protein
MTAVVPSPRPPVLQGLTWSVVRLHRTALWLWLAFVAVMTGVLLRALWLSEQAERHNEACLPRCIDLAPFDGYVTLHVLGRAMSLLPLAVAVFAGGALIGRELEQGTAALSWVQSVSPVRWLATKLAVPALLLATGAAVLALLFRSVWTSGRPGERPGWYENDIFLSTGPALAAHVLLALTLGALAGMLMRRTLSGLGLAFSATALVLVTAGVCRASLWPKSRTALDGVAVTDWEVTHVARPGAAAGEPDALVHPVAHYWPLQFVETGIVLTLGALACWACFALLRRRTA